MCNSTDLPEFEIISLLEEQLPVYRLRADTVYGYDHDDWLHTPLVAPDTRLDLTTEQIDETLKYFCEFDSSPLILDGGRLNPVWMTFTPLHLVNSKNSFQKDNLL